MDIAFHLETVCEMSSDPSFKLTLNWATFIKYLSKRLIRVGSETHRPELRRKNEVVSKK